MTCINFKFVQQSTIDNEQYKHSMHSKVENFDAFRASQYRIVYSMQMAVNVIRINFV